MADVAERQEVVVARDREGRVTALTCPHCGRDDIREHDRAERWNRIEVVDDTLSVWQGQADFETVGFVCADCHRPLDAPQDIYDRMTWS